MKALLINESPVFGGAEVSFVALARALAACGAGVSLATPPWPPVAEQHWDRAREAGIPLHPATGPLAPSPAGRLGRWMRRPAVRRVAAILAETRPDLVLFNLPTVERGAAVLDAVASASPRPVVAGYLHLPYPPSRIGARYASWLRDRLAPINLRRFDLLLAVSRTTAEVASRMVPGTIPVVYEAVPALEKPVSLNRATARAQLGLPDGPLVGLVGRVVCWHKGHDAAVRVAATLRYRGARPTWVVVGDGPDLLQVQRMVQDAGLGECFRFLGWRTDAAEILPAFDVVALPSRYEGMPLVAIEAMHAGVPVVGYAVDGMQELLNPPFAVSPGDEQAFVRGLEFALTDPGRWPTREKQVLARDLCHPTAVARRVLEALASA